MFLDYLQLGFEHILDIEGYDHILFVLTLCAIYSFDDWKKVIKLVTAFTIGHSITLALSVLDIISIPSDIIETLIPVTIILTAIINFISTEDTPTKSKVTYLVTLVFGFIHGMGFSNYLKALLAGIESVTKPLLAFNIGVELGQLIVVCLGLVIAYIFTGYLKLQKTIWVYIISSLAILVSLQLLFEKV